MSTCTAVFADCHAPDQGGSVCSQLLRRPLWLVLILSVLNLLHAGITEGYQSAVYDYTVAQKSLAPVVPLAFSPDGKYLALYSPRFSDSLIIANLSNGSFRRISLPAGSETPPSVSFALKGEVLAKRDSFEETATFVNADNGADLGALPARGSVALSEDAAYYLEFEYGGINKRDPHGVMVSLPFDNNDYRETAVSEGARYVAFTSHPVSLLLSPEEPVAQTQPLVLLQTSDWKTSTRSVPVATGKIAVSSSGCVAAVVGDEVVLNVGTPGQTALAKLDAGSYVKSLRFSADGKHLLVDVSPLLKVIDVEKKVIEYEAKVDGGSPHSLIAPDGKFLVIAQADGSLSFVETATGATAARFFQLPAQAWAVIDAAGRYDSSGQGVVAEIAINAPGGQLPLPALKEQIYDAGLLGKHLLKNKAPLRHLDPLFAEVKEPRLVVQAGHSASVGAVAYSPGGKLIASGDSSGKVIVWQEQSRRILRMLEAHTSRVSGVAFLGTSTLVSAGEEGFLKFWDIATGRCRKVIAVNYDDHPDAIKQLSLSARGEWLAVITDSLRLTIYSAATGEVVAETAGKSSITSSAFSASGDEIFFSDYDGKIWDWRFAKGGKPSLLHDCSHAVLSLALSGDAAMLLAGGTQDFLRAIDPATGKTIRDIPVKTEFTEEISAVMFTGRGSEAAVIKETIVSVDAKTGKILQRYGPELHKAFALSVASGGAIISGEERGRLNLWTSAAAPVSFGEEAHIPRSVAVLPGQDGKSMRLVTSTNQTELPPVVPEAQSGAGTLELWDLDKGDRRTLLKEGKGFIHPVSSARGGSAVLALVEKLADASFVPGKVKSLELRGPDGSLLKTITQDASHDSPYSCAADGVYCLVGHPVSSKEMSELQLDVLDLSTGTFVATIETPAKGPRGYAVPNIGVSRDGRFAFGSFPEGTRVWQLPSGRLLKELPLLTALAFTDDGENLVATESFTKIVPERRLHMISTVAGKEATLLPFPATGQSFVSPEVCAGCDRTLAALEGFTYLDDRHAVKIGDRRIELWEMAPRKRLGSLFSFQDGTWVVVDGEGRFDTNNLEAIKGLHWIMPDEPLKTLPLELFMRDYYEPRLLPRLLAGETMRPVRPLMTLNRNQPEVAIESVKQEADGSATVVVNVQEGRGGGRKSGIFDLRLFRNGQLVGWRDDSVAQGRITFKGLRLPTGTEQNRNAVFSAYAFNSDRVKSATFTRELPLSESKKPKRKAYVVSIGVNAYDDPSLDLLFAASDARDMNDRLTSRLKKTGAFDDVIGLTLTSESKDELGTPKNKGTKEIFRCVASTLAGKGAAACGDTRSLQTATPDDLVIVSFSGHGYADRNGIFYLIPSDAGPVRGKNPQMGRSISSDELTKWLREVDAGSFTFLLDACHSAAAVEGGGFKPGPMGSRGLGQLAYDKGITIMAATQADDVALEAEAISHGLLTYALVVEGLDQEKADFDAADGRITFNEWLRFGVRRVPEIYTAINDGTLEKGIGKARLSVRGTGAEGFKKRREFQQPSLFDFNRTASDYILSIRQ